MQFKKSFELRDVCGEKVLIASGIENIDFGALVNLNSTAADIYNHFADREFTKEDIVAFLTAEYDVDADTALRDTTVLLDNLMKAGVIEA